MEAGANDRDPIDELAMLADELLQQAAEIRRQWQELGEALGMDLPAEGAPTADDLEPLTARAAPQPRVEIPQDAQSGGADPVRLVALDMMLSGSSRDEVVEYLSATFGDHVDESVIDEVFSGS
jgi:hypothetical protein